MNHQTSWISLAQTAGLITSFTVSSMFGLAAEASTCNTNLSTNKSAMTSSKKMVRGTIVDVAVANGSFNTLVVAVKAAGLVDTLASKGPFTVFAPTDAAFAALPKGTLEMLLKPENKDKLTRVLTYHVVSGKVTSNQIKPGSLKTVEGSSMNLKVSRGKVMVNNANVIAANVAASNGVIHAIDKVILPPDL